MQTCECVLVVSHGAALRELYLHFHKNLGCELPAGMGERLHRISPNTGISEYAVE